MARIAAETKGGYYPTPPSQMAHVCRRLTVEPGTELNLFDPCCGEGAALKQMAEDLASKGAAVKTYGVELESGRAKKAKKALDHVLHSGYEAIRMTNEVISAMWLNPPYDVANGERVEVRFLRDLTERRLQPGGLLMFCIPQYVLRNAASTLAARFFDLAVYRFTDDDYPVFKQVVVFGYRREQSDAGPEARKTKEWLANLGYLGPEAVPSLDEDDGKTFSVPAAAGPVAIFRDSRVDVDEARAAVLKSPVFAQVERLITPPPPAQVQMKTPVMPLKLAHMGTAIAAGAVGGNMGTHIIVGTTKKTVETYEKGKDTIAQVERIETSVKVFSPEGIFTL